MISLSANEPARAPEAASPGTPGLRTLRSPTFRSAVALVLLIIGVSLVGMMLVRQAGLPYGQYAIDFADFHRAAERMAAGESPYAAEMLAGPTDAQGQDRYRYPPLFAQALTPFTALSFDTGALLWLMVQAIAVTAAVWIGTGIGGAARSLERGLWCAVAAVFFLPFFDTLWKGNVSGVIALSTVVVALGGSAAGVGAAFGALLKGVPGTLVPAALVMDRRARVAVLISLGLGVGLSFLLAPAAWLDYPVVVRNMLAGSADYTNNLAPGATVGRLGLPSVVADLVRLATLGVAVASVVGSVLLARTPAGLPAAALLGAIALLLLPSTAWYHYLVILLPFAAMAWPRAGSKLRGALFISAAAITIGLTWLPLAVSGAVALAGLSLAALWPRATRTTLS